MVIGFFYSLVMQKMESTMKIKSLYNCIFTVLGSKFSPYVLVIYCLSSFVLGQILSDMNLFAASGAIVTIFGLISMIKFTTIEKFINKETIVASSTGVTGPPLSEEEYEAIVKANQEAARIRIEKELKSELKGISLTMVGTLIWAYGVYFPLLFVTNA